MSVDRMHKVTLVVYYTHHVLVNKYRFIFHVVFKMNYICFTLHLLLLYYF